MSNETNKLNVLGVNVRRNRKTTQEMVTDALREAILNGYLEEGKSIETIHLAEVFGVSRMPIRIALQQLEREGLVELQPHKKAIIVKLSSTEVRKIYVIRYELESLAIRLSVPNLTDADIEKLDSYIEQMDQCDDPNLFISLNKEFHNMIYFRSDNEKLNELIVQFRNNTDRYLRIYLREIDHFKKANKEHRLIVSAIKDKNINDAELWTRRHLSSVCETIAKFLERRERQV